MLPVYAAPENRTAALHRRDRPRRKGADSGPSL